MPTSHYIGLCRPNWAVEIAIYSLTGNARSPFHAEPAQPDLTGKVLVPRFRITPGGVVWQDIRDSDDAIAEHIGLAIKEWSDTFFLNTRAGEHQWTLDTACRTLMSWIAVPDDRHQLLWTTDGFRVPSFGDAVRVRFTFNVVDAWEFEPWDTFRKRVYAALETAMAEFKHSGSEYYRSIGYDPQRSNRCVQHFDWLVLYQTRRMSPQQIKSTLGVKAKTIAAIQMGVRSAASRIGLQLRPAKRKLASKQRT